MPTSWPQIAPPRRIGDVIPYICASINSDGPLFDVHDGFKVAPEIATGGIIWYPTFDMCRFGDAPSGDTLHSHEETIGRRAVAVASAASMQAVSDIRAYLETFWSAYGNIRPRIYFVELPKVSVSGPICVERSDWFEVEFTGRVRIVIPTGSLRRVKYGKDEGRTTIAAGSAP